VVDRKLTAGLAAADLKALIARETPASLRIQHIAPDGAVLSDASFDLSGEAQIADMAREAKATNDTRVARWREMIRTKAPNPHPRLCPA
jgi:hypothetical protein